MNAAELRLDNYIETKDGEIEQVYILYDDGINGYDGEGGIIPDDQEDFKPILLTDKWLTDFGCEKIDPSGCVTVGATYWDKDGIVFYKSGNKYYIPIGEKTDKTDHNCIEFDKVHELQNIFALTGNELTKP